MFSINSLPEFRPHPALRGGHRQTIAAYYLPQPAYREQAAALLVPVEHDEQIVLHEDTPPGWQPGSPVALLIHGLGGCHGSPYMQRMARRMTSAGVRSYRMDMRGCGAGFALGWRPPHSDRVGDLLAALATVGERSPDSPLVLIGYSLGGNLVLNTLAARCEETSTRVKLALAICPPIDLFACSDQLRRKRIRIYDRFFLRLLMPMLQRKRRALPQMPEVALQRRPNSLWEFDDRVTAPLAGFESAEHYYRSTSPLSRLASIRVPTFIIAADDDPLIPAEIFSGCRRSDSLDILITRGGGHMGYVAQRSEDPDRRWIDWRILDCLASISKPAAIRPGLA